MAQAEGHWRGLGDASALWEKREAALSVLRPMLASNTRIDPAAANVAPIPDGQRHALLKVPLEVPSDPFSPTTTALTDPIVVIVPNGEFNAYIPAATSGELLVRDRAAALRDLDNDPALAAVAAHTRTESQRVAARHLHGWRLVSIYPALVTLEGLMAIAVLSWVPLEFSRRYSEFQELEAVGGDALRPELSFVSLAPTFVLAAAAAGSFWLALLRAHRNAVRRETGGW